MALLTINTDDLFAALFSTTEHILPSLKGEFIDDNSHSATPLWLDAQNIDTNLIARLYSEIKFSSAEAGNAYWLSRTWSLLCWQPLYIAMIGVHCCQLVPRLSTIQQANHPQFIAGYGFKSHEYRTGRPHLIIPFAAKELTTLFQRFQEAINQWGRIRPGFVEPLIADGVLAAFVLVKRHLQTQQIALDEACLTIWFNELNLPKRYLNTLYQNSQNQLDFIRNRCCLVYKCSDRNYCQRCPKRRS